MDKVGIMFGPEANGRTMKSHIIEQLGQADLLLPSLIAEGLAANDRIKVRMSALQAAAQHARQPGQPIIVLDAECRAAGLDPAATGSLIRGAHLGGDGRMAAPDLGALTTGMVDDVTAMIRAVKAGTPTDGDAAGARLATIMAATSLDPAPDIELAQIAQLTGVSEKGGDSLHRLVMDLHKALNRLAASCADDVVAGAHVYGLRPEDHAAVACFMRGLDQTRALKFDHPGLATTATRSGERLLIQNDIGTTDAHVVVIAVETNTVTVTYTDVHLARANFFVGLFDDSSALWSGLDRKTADGFGDDGAFFLVTGTYRADSSAARDAFLAAIGSALVFLIDWNKARKLLRVWVPKNDAVRILDWAARQRVGHRAFLELGGEALIGSAVRHATPTRIGFGERLDQALGREAAVDFLKAVLRICTEALTAGRSLRLVHDEIETDLVRHLERVDSMLLAIVVRQMGLAHDIATAIAHHIADLRSGRPANGKTLATRARQIEEKADRIAVDARAEVSRFNAGPIIEQLVDRVEETIDELEQAAFIASLVPAGIDAGLLKTLAEICDAAISGAKAAASGLVAAAEAPEGRRADSEDALAAVARLIDVEHEADAREREVTTQVFGGDFGLTASLSVLELSRAIERATDRLAGIGHLLRRHIMADLSA